MRTWRITAIAALALLAVAGTVHAQSRLVITDGHEREDLLAQGWTQVDEGLWERTAENGRRETFVHGAAGLAKVLPSLRERQAQLTRDFLADPTEAKKRAVDEQAQLIEAVEANARAARVRGSRPKAAAAPCTRTFSYGADVRSFHCLDVADASASYSTDNPTGCPQQCTVHTYGYISTTCTGVLVADSETCTQTGTNVACQSWANGQFAAPCYDYAYASIHCPQLNDLFLSESDSTTGCFCGC